MIVSFEISQKGIKCVCFEKRAKSLVVTQAHALDFSYDIFDPYEAKRASKSLKELVLKKRIPTKNVYVSISHPGILFKEQLINPLPSKEIERVVVSDIKKIPAFSDKEYLYAYHTYQLYLKKKIKILSVVLAKELLNAALEILKGSGIEPRDIDITPFNILPLFYGKLEFENTCVVMLEEKVSYLLLISKGQCNDLYVTNSGFEDIWDFEAAAINQAAFELWANEIKRALKFYETESERVYSDVVLIWDQKMISGLDDMLSSCMERKVNSFKLPESVRLHKKMSGALFNFKFIPCVGAALKAIKIKHEFNLERFWPKQRMNVYQSTALTFFTIYLAVLLFLGLPFLIAFIGKTSKLRNQARSLSSQAESIESQIDETYDLMVNEAQTRELLSEQISVASRPNSLPWSKALSAVQSSIPRGAWLKGFSFDQKGKCEIAGVGTNLDVIALFLRELKKHESFRDVKLEFTRQKKINKESFEEFKIKAQLEPVIKK